MSFFKVADPIVPTGGNNPTGSPKVQVWASNAQYGDGQIVIFNGSQYVASGVPPVGLVPPIEVATPQIPGQPRWILAARGRSLPETYDDTKTYFQDQVITCLGATYILDAPTVAAGTKPARDRRWTRLSEALTDAEAAKVSTGDLSGFLANTTSTIFHNADEVPRVRHHWVRLSAAGVIGTGQIYVMTFPRPILSEARPAISVHYTDGAHQLLLTAVPLVSGNQVTGYQLLNHQGIAAGTYEFLVTVKEQIDQVRVP